MDVDRLSAFDVCVNAVEDRDHILTGGHPSVPYGFPLKGDIQTHVIGDRRQWTLIGLERLPVPIKLVRLHETDHVADPVVEKTSELPVGFLPVHRPRVAAGE